jgi:hypothetical protein
MALLKFIFFVGCRKMTTFISDPAYSIWYDSRCLRCSPGKHCLRGWGGGGHSVCAPLFFILVMVHILLSISLMDVRLLYLHAVYIIILVLYFVGRKPDIWFG